MRKKLICAAMAAVAILPAFGAGRAQKANFDTQFADTTLRVDFHLSGTCDSLATPHIAFANLSKHSGWGGRRVNLTHTPFEGNADVVVTSAAGDTLYINPFSTLFQEWLTAEDSTGPKTMEGTVLIPMPRRKANVTIRLRDKYRRPQASATLSVDPTDILIADNTRRAPLPHTYIHRGSNPNRISVAILAEGYRPEEMDKFRTRAAEAVDAIFRSEPFGEMKEYFDFVAVESPSAESGVTIPKKGDWRDTAFGSHFSTFYSDRYLTTPRVARLYDALTSLPCQHIIVLANTDNYGGGGIFNFYTLTTADHKDFRPVVVHEFGHSFGGLADEYFYDNDVLNGTYTFTVEPWEPNITNKVDFASKWPDLVASGEASLVEGGGYYSKGMWRGADDCRMRTNTAEGFCPVCRRALMRNILWLTTPDR